MKLIDIGKITDKYSVATNRLILLDYDGTLAPFENFPDLARPTAQVIDLLCRLIEIPSNTLFIVSGRDPVTLSTWFESLGINLVAEHGAWIRHNEVGWEARGNVESDWMPRYMEIFNRYNALCIGAFTEVKMSSIAWHYRNVSESFESYLTDLLSELNALNMESYLEIIMGNKVIEIRRQHFSKGNAVKSIIADRCFDFVLCCGDDATDEDMFDVLKGIDHAFTIKVGEGETLAKYHTASPHDILDLCYQLL